HDVPDFPVDRAPSSKTDHDKVGPAALAGDDPFIMQAAGKGWLFAPDGMYDEPMPTDFEQTGSTVHNAMYDHKEWPARLRMHAQGNKLAPAAGHPGSQT